jgi:hypothetical protein
MITAFGSSVSCSSSSQEIISPSASKCQVTVAATPAAFAATGGAGTLDVTTNRECGWTAAASGGWIQLAEQTSGQGNGRVAFTVNANPDVAERRGAITVHDRQVPITQDAAPCAFVVTPITDSVAAGGERRAIAIAANGPHCSWTAQSETEWIVLVQDTEGRGSGRVVYEARSTAGPSRRGALVVAGQRVTVNQGDGCTIAIAQTSQSFGAAGGSGTIAVTTAADCSWSAQSHVAWVSIESAAGTGPGSIVFAVDPNAGPARTGTLVAAGHVFTVRQASGCTFTVHPASYQSPHGGGAGSLTVSSGAGCSWTATSAAEWVRITAGQTGAGSGTVAFTVDHTPTSYPRSTTISVAGRTVGIDQAGAPCSFVLGPASAQMGIDGGPGTFEVNVAEACPWTAASNDGWLHVTGGTSGSGDGVVHFSADANAGPPRVGTIIAGGRTFTVSQAGA